MPTVELNSTTAMPTEECLTWRVHLYRVEPTKSLAVLGAACASFAVGLGLMQSPVFALMGPLLILGSASEYLLPITYRLSPIGAEVRYGLVNILVEWERVKRVLVSGDVVKLSVFERDTKLEPFRGALVRCAPAGVAGDKASVLAAVDRFRDMKP